MSTFQPSQYSYPSTPQSYGFLPLVPAVVGLGGGAILAAILLPTFIINPLILKAFLPKWSYGRRVLGGMGITAAAGMTYQIAKAAGGHPDSEEA